MPEVIRVEWRHELAQRLAQSGVAGASDAVVLGADQADARVARCGLGRNGGGGVARAVIDDEDVQGAMRLGTGRSQRLAERAGSVEGGNDHGDERLVRQGRAVLSVYAAQQILNLK